MMQLHQDKSEFEKKDTKIIIVGPENKQTFNKFFNSNGYDFIGIPDAKNSILKTYGQEINIFKLGRMPAQVLIDKAGIARFVYYGHSMSDIPENKDVLKIIDEI
ncbi:MAG: alkyl hydroperoxide reductase [Fusobacteria bacterium]|nr:MAG: alkyl hydroperoxide reductase [Fusobacteriota bacterium]KAF0229680.1 MAG: alkyl hydroperoxide [Fusobacteriota bacterium]